MLALGVAGVLCAVMIAKGRYTAAVVVAVISLVIYLLFKVFGSSSESSSSDNTASSFTVDERVVEQIRAVLPHAPKSAVRKELGMAANGIGGVVEV